MVRFVRKIPFQCTRNIAQKKNKKLNFDENLNLENPNMTQDRGKQEISVDT